jgi:hypothetical protein
MCDAVIDGQFGHREKRGSVEAAHTLNLKPSDLSTRQRRGRRAKGWRGWTSSNICCASGQVARPGWAKRFISHSDKQRAFSPSDHGERGHKPAVRGVILSHITAGMAGPE